VTSSHQSIFEFVKTRAGTHCVVQLAFARNAFHLLIATFMWCGNSRGPKLDYDPSKLVHAVSPYVTESILVGANKLHP
jgi:hypothetical protein